jgi:hypothetical protein
VLLSSPTLNPTRTSHTSRRSRSPNCAALVERPTISLADHDERGGAEGDEERDPSQAGVEPALEPLAVLARRLDSSGSSAAATAMPNRLIGRM